MESPTTNGYRELGDGMVVCDACGAVHSPSDGGQIPASCERCGQVFGSETADDAKDELVHYEIDCPKCGTHYSLDVEPGPVVFDCDRCECAFTVSDGSTPSAEEEAVAPMRPEVPTFTQAMHSKGSQRRVHKSRGRSGSFLKSRAGGLSLLLITATVVGFLVWDAVKSHQEKSERVKSERAERVAEKADEGDQTPSENRGFFVRPAHSEVGKAVANVLLNLANATNDEERLMGCRHPEQTRPRLKSWLAYSRMPVPHNGELRFVEGPFEVVAPNRRLFVYSVVRYGDDKDRHLVAEILPNGVVVVELELFVEYSEFNWATLKTQRPAKPFEALVHIERSTRYPREYSPSEYESYRVYQGNGINSFSVFVERGSEVHTALQEAFDAEPFPLNIDTGRRKSRLILGEFSLPAERDPSINLAVLRRVVVPDAVDWQGEPAR